MKGIAMFKKKGLQDSVLQCFKYTFQFPNNLLVPKESRPNYLLTSSGSGILLNSYLFLKDHILHTEWNL